MNKELKTKTVLIEKRYNILIFIISVLIIVLFVKLFYVQIVKFDYYSSELQKLTNLKIEGSTAPRGRIYDRNNKLIVDNEPVRVIYYEKNNNTIKKELEIANEISNMIDIENKASIKTYKKYWMVIHPKETENKITKKEWNLYKYHKLTKDDILNLKLKRITEKELSSLSEHEMLVAYIYELMNKGYKLDEKIIKDKDVSDEEYALVAANLSKLDGVGVRLDWKRSYPYGNTFKSILGTVSNNVPSNLESYYLKRGYLLNDKVGTSYLEYQYDNYLKGDKNIYTINDDNEKILLEKGNRGSDISLTIDIELQNDLEKLLEKEVVKTKKELNTEYYNRTFVIITNPKTGDILAMAGKKVMEDKKRFKIYDYTPSIMTSPITAGSVVKGASHIVGYNTNALKIGEVRTDRCVKLSGTPLKCSWMPLGSLNDITALKKSSNTYQYYTAMKVANTKYHYNTSMKPNDDAFKIYRKTFKQFGLGSETGIDLPLESTGNIGKKNAGGLLLDFAIGQYDTYTPLELSQYISTIANDGSRMKLHLLKNVYSKEDTNKIIYKYKNTLLNKVDTKEKYLKRVKRGFSEVLKYGGTGYGYIDLKYKPAGKTGTSQSFVDTNSDGKIDKETITTTFVAYAPYDDPKVTFTIVSPDISNYDNYSNYQSNLNSRLMRKISKLYFEKYEKNV